MFNIADFIRKIPPNWELLINLALKNIKVQYRQPWLGFLWAFFVPLFMIIIFKFIFSVILRIQIAEYPFFIYLMTAVFPWKYFQDSVVSGTNSILNNKNLVKEAAFPRELLPISVVIANLINFIPSLVIMFLFLHIFRLGISGWFLLLPVIVLLHTFFIIGFVLLTSCLQVKFRDLNYIVEVLVFALFYLTPVFYPLNLVEQYLNPGLFKLYIANPLVGMLNLYRIAFLPGFYRTLPEQVQIFDIIVIPLIWTGFIFATGIFVFRKQKYTFNDYIAI
ncbi:MAG: ABC transporter permease [Candidatus Omnitrophota bacterium]